MKFLSKPSHYLALLLTLTGGLLMVQGDKVLPKEGPKKERWQTQQERLSKLRSLAKRHESGKNDMLTVKNGAASSSNVQEHSDQPALAQLITLAGSVAPELRYPDSDEKVTPRTEPYPVNLELIWMDEGETPGLGVLFGHTDEKGHFDFKGLKPGAYRLRAIPEDKDALHLAVAKDFRIPQLEEQSPGQQPRYAVSELTLPLPRRMQGTCAWAASADDSSKDSTEDMEASKPDTASFEGLKVSVSEVGIDRGFAIADAEGRFQIEGVGEGPYTIKIRNTDGDDLGIAECKTAPQSKGEVPMLVLARQHP